MVGEGEDIDLVDRDPAGCGSVEEPEDMQKRRFTATTRPHDPDELAPADLKRDACKGVDLHPAHRVDPGEVLCGDHGFIP